MAIYKIPEHVIFPQQGIFGESTYSVVPLFEPTINFTMPLITMTSTCGGVVIFQLNPSYGVVGDANADPALMNEFNNKVTAYMADLEVI